MPFPPEIELESAGLRVAGRLPTPVASGQRLEVCGWSSAHHLVIPGAVQAGNRFRRLEPQPYPSKAGPEAMVPDPPLMVMDIPRLSAEPGRSEIQILSGSVSAPIVAWWDPSAREATLITFPLRTAWGETGIEVVENEARDRLDLTFWFPGVRTRRYRFPDLTTEAPSFDPGHLPIEGETLTTIVTVETHACPDLAGLADRVFQRMRAGAEGASLACALPISEAAAEVRRHFGSDLWWPEAGLHRASPFEANPYQTGWCSGIIAQAAMLATSDDPELRRQCHVHLDRALTDGIAECGLFYGKYNGRGWVSDCWYDAERMPWRAEATLTRRQGDALAYGLRALEAIEERGEAVPPTWEAGLRRNADALTRLWEREQQFGFLLHQSEGRVLQGNSASGAMIPAGLLLAHGRWGEEAHLRAALESLAWLEEAFLTAGVFCGGPSDAAQAPDSESVAAMVESCALAAEVTGDARWTAVGVRAAHLFATWVVTYRYPFPDTTEFGRLGMNSVGAVFANAQNTHAAPGICTHSGVGLLRLFRQSGEVRLLELLRDLVRALPQYVSRADRPIYTPDGTALPNGWINERVNLNDWDDLHGGVFYQPCWPEVSLMLSEAELPSIVADPLERWAVSLDHVTAAWVEDELVLTNPTAWSADVTVLLEDASARSQPLSRRVGWPRIVLEPGEQRSITIP